MDVRYYYLSQKGIRPKNEDFLGYWQPTTPEEWRSAGAVMLLADGVGGQGDGDLASRIAVNTGLEVFRQAKPNTSPAVLLRQMFEAANLAVYDAGVEAVRASGAKTRMATTLSICLLRNDQLHIGHVGDCRVYRIHGGRIARLTTDHSYAGVQLKLGLIDVNEAATSELRSLLTRSVGQDPLIRIDTQVLTVHPGDFILQATDGLYCSATERELYEIVSRWPEMAPTELRDLCERRHCDDNFSAQILQLMALERVTHYRGMQVYMKARDLHMAEDLQVGQVLDGRYQVTDLISKSGMASIFKATDLKDNTTVAIKVPFMRFEADPGFYDRFRREQEIGQKLRHPYILRVEPEDSERSRPYLVMEYLQGQTLGHLMHAIRPMPVDDALVIASRICEALQYMHFHEVIHRDLKPDNIMICNDGSIRIMDFGIAKVEGARRLTFGGFQPAMGTPDYMAPEQVRGKRGDPRTDIYALGAILYEMVTGHPPFEGANPLVIMNARLTGDPIAPRRHNPEISPQVEEIILHAMARQPGDRYPSAEAFRHDLRHPEEVRVTGRADRLIAPSALKSGWQRHRWIFLAVAIPVLIFLIVFLSRHLAWK